MHIDLSGKTALVTGSTQGIGLAIATGLARAGARVAVNGRTAEKVATAAHRRARRGGHRGCSRRDELAVSRGYAKEAAGAGVTVNAVIARPTHTAGVQDFVYQLIDADLPWDQAQYEFMRLHRPQSTAATIDQAGRNRQHGRLLASPLATATTGGALRVDGGYVDSILP